jgi:hypothetical protein
VTTPPQPPLPAPDQGPRPAPLVVACALAGLEAAALVVLGVVELVALEGTKLTMGITTALFFALYGAGLGVFAWLLHRLESWTRAPVVLAQLIQLGVAWSFRGTPAVAVLLAVVAAVVLAGIFHPASLRALADEDA